ncbi:MAG: FtsX-like permease family protein [Myxococcota bacterium]
MLAHPNIKTVSATLVGLRSKLGIFRMRGWINGFEDEPLMAVLPARVFQRLWSTVSVMEKTLMVVAGLVTLAGLIALAASLLAAAEARRREMALLRSVGASAWTIGSLVLGEAVLIAVASGAFALLLVAVGSYWAAPTLLSDYGIRLQSVMPRMGELRWLLAFVAAALAVAWVPAFASYRRTLADGLVMRS